MKLVKCLKAFQAFPHYCITVVESKYYFRLEEKITEIVYSPCKRQSVLGHCRQKLTRSGNDFQIAGPHVRQFQLAVEILNSLSNKSGLTIQKNSYLFSSSSTKIVLFCCKTFCQPF